MSGGIYGACVLKVAYMSFILSLEYMSVEVGGKLPVAGKAR